MKIFEWLGGVMMIIALLEFVPNPKKAIQSIPEVLATNVHMNGNHLVLHKTEAPKKRKQVDEKGRKLMQYLGQFQNLMPTRVEKSHETSRMHDSVLRPRI